MSTDEMKTPGNRKQDTRESEELFSATFEQAAVGIAHVAPEGQWLRVNQKLCDIVGYSQDELMKLTFQDITFPEDLETDLAYVRQMLAGEITTYSMEKRYIRKDKSIIWVNLTVSLVRKTSGEPKSFIKVIDDITARKQAEAALRESEERFRKVFEEGPLGIAMADDTEGRFFRVNRAFCEMLGYTEEELKRLTFVDVTHPDHHALDLEAVKKIREGQIQEHRTEKRYLKKNGEVVWGARALTKISSADGKSVYNLAMIKDITERKKAEEKIKEAKEEWERTFDAIVDPIMILDTNYRIVKANKAMAEALGKTPEEAVGLTCYEHVHFTKEPKPECPNKKLLADGQPHMAEIYEELLGGWFLVSVSPLFDKGGSLTGSVHYARNITVLKQAEEAIRKREDDLNRAQEVAHIGSWHLDVPGNELKWSDEVYRIFGVPFNTPITYEMFLAAVRPEDRAYVDSCWKAALAGQPYDIEHCIVKAGEVKWVHEKAELVFNEIGEPLHGIGTVQDITERKRSEDLLRESEEKFRQIAESIQEVFWMTDPEKNRMLYISPAYEKIWGRTLQSLYEEPKAWLEAIHPEDRTRVLDAAIKKQVAGEYDEEYRIIRPDGSLRWIRDKAFPIRDKDGRVYRVVGIAEDVTDRKHLEEQFRQAQKMEAIGQLAGGVAHDFNNVLNVIIGYGDLALTKMPKDDPLRSNIEYMLEAGDRAANLTKDLLIFSRKQVSDRNTLDLNKLIRKVEKFLKRVIGEDIECKTIICEHPLKVFADSHQLEQVIMNLATNARDAMPQGGLFTVTTEQVNLNEDLTVAHGYGKPGDYAMITVSDTGKGMDEATQKRIFEPFFTTKEAGKGTGLGLAVVYGIVRQHDGLINMSSEPGKGTTFRIYLPIVSALVTEEPRAEQEDAPARGTETVLIAEDDASLRKLSRTVLTHFGYIVIEAVDGEDAVQKFMENKDRIQLLLFDLIMPKMNGKEAYDEIRKMKPDMKVIFASGYEPDIIRQKTLIEGNATLIFKPISPGDLLRKVRSVLDGRDA